MTGKTIAVWFSCGAASAVAAKKTIELYGEHNTVLVVNNPIKEEDPDNVRFLLDIEKWIGQKIILATNSAFPSCSVVEVWDKRKFMSGPKGAPCTSVLKKEARYQFELRHKIDWHVMGYTADERSRHDDFVKYERENLLPVLIEANITKDDCFVIMQAEEIDVPLMYKLEYPNANCPGCVKATSPTYWNHVRVTHPEVFRQRAEQSRRLGARLVRYKGQRIFLDELPVDAKGRPMKSYKPKPCSIFCNTD